MPSASGPSSASGSGGDGTPVQLPSSNDGNSEASNESTSVQPPGTVATVVVGPWVVTGAAVVVTAIVVGSAGALDAGASVSGGEVAIVAAALVAVSVDWVAEAMVIDR